MENILVTVRFKPNLVQKREDQDRPTSKPLLECWKLMLEPHNVVSNLRTKQSFTYDYVFGEDSSNSQIFEILALPLVQCFLEGINCTIFAYGQTSSGKTFTIQGTPQHPGLVTLGIKYIFAYIKENPRTYIIKISYLEVYNEQVNDLLDPSRSNLEIRERPDKDIYVDRLSEIIVDSETKAFELLALGDSNRKTGETNMNQVSSRSHCVFKIGLESHDSFSKFVSQLNFVDLAGSEGVQKTKAEDLRLREGSNINRSLLSLSTVIQKLSEIKGPKNFINFRDSKMTRLLQPALTGNSRTAVICTVNPDISHYQETLNTLLFGCKAKKIKTDARLNEIIINEEQIKNFSEENKKLCDKVLELENALTQSSENFNFLIRDKEEKWKKEEFDKEKYIQKILQEIDACKQEIQQKTWENNELRVENQSCKHTSYQLNQAVLERSRENANLLQKIEEINMEIKNKEENEKQMHKAQIEYQEKLQSLERTLASVLEKHHQTEAEFLKANQSIHELKAVINSLEQLNSEKSAQIQALTESLSEFPPKITQLSSENSDLKNEIDNLSALLLTKSQSHSISSKEIADLQANNSTLKQDLANLTKNAMQKEEQTLMLQGQLDAKKMILKNYESLFEELSLKLNNYQDTNSTLSNELKQKSELYSKLVIEFQSISESHDEVSKELEKSRKTIEKKDQEIKNSHEENSKNLSKLESIVKELRDENDCEVNLRLEVEYEASDLKFELDRLREKLAQTSTSPVITSESLEIAQEHYDLLLKNFEELSNANKNNLNKIAGLEELKNSLELELSSTREEVRKYQAEMKKMEKSHSFKRLSSALIDESMTEVITQSERYKLMSEMAKIGSENKIFKEDLEISNKVISELRTELELKSEVVTNLIKEKQEINEKIGDYQKSLVKCKNEIGYLIAERDELLCQRSTAKIAGPRAINKEIYKAGVRKKMEFDSTKSPNCKTQ